MAMKLMCDRLGIECLTVLGRREGADCGWNLVNVGGEWYHLDAFRRTLDGEEGDLLKNDAAMADDYLWDVARYPASTAGETPEAAETGPTGGGSSFVRPSDETPPPEGTEPPEETPPESTEPPEEPEPPEETPPPDEPEVTETP